MQQLSTLIAALTAALVAAYRGRHTPATYRAALDTAHAAYAAIWAHIEGEKTR